MKNCCICDNNKYVFDFSNKLSGPFSLSKCKKCDLVILNETNANADDFFKDASLDYDYNLVDDDKKRAIYWSFPEMYKKHKDLFDYFYLERIERLLKEFKEIKTIFDIGTGYGLWSKFCQDKGYDIEGIELSKEPTEYCVKELNLNVTNIDLMSFKFKKKYDVFTMCDVLEHLENPNLELQKIRENMHVNSILYLQVPNVMGFRIPSGYSLNLPHHLWQFNYKSLSKLLRKNGFKVIKRYSGIMGITGYYEKEKVSFLDKIKWFIANNFNLGNRLIIMCKKED